MGVPLKDLIEKHAGGVVGGWDNLKAARRITTTLPKQHVIQLKWTLMHVLKTKQV